MIHFTLNLVSNSMSLFQAPENSRKCPKSAKTKQSLKNFDLRYSSAEEEKIQDYAEKLNLV